METKQILLFGGTFDPIHSAHVQLAETMLRHTGADEVWFMITPQNPWKANQQLTADEHRLAMARLALQNHDGLVACDYEFHLDKPTYTYQTLRHLRHDYPDCSFSLLIGGDNWDKFEQWAEYQEILDNHKVVVYPRTAIAGQPTKGEAEGKFSLLNVSSTEIRRRIREGIDTEGMIAPGVAQYIKQHSLYV